METDNLRMMKPCYLSRLRWVLLLLPLALLISCDQNYPPRIVAVEFVRLPGIGNNTYQLSVEASDPDLDPLKYLWEAETGEFLESRELIETTWRAPEGDTDLVHEIRITVSDGKESIMSTLAIPVAAVSYGKLTGFVYFAGSKFPVADVRVSIDGKDTLTNIRGEFTLDGIRTGRQTVTASKAEFDTGSTDLIVKNTLNNVVVYVSSEIHTSRLYGNITGALSGESRPYHTVTILNPDLTRSQLSATSNSGGYYEIAGIPRGFRRLVVRDDLRDRMETSVFIEPDDRLFNIALPELTTFTDERDGRQYKAVKISSQIWMAENLAYIPKVSPAYEQGGIWVYGYTGSDPSAARLHPNYLKYGCLYDWSTATAANHGNGRDICPPGWHLPDDAEWKVLEQTLGMEMHELDSVSWRYSGDVGRKMKSEAGWESEGNGSNSSSFGAVPAGYRTTGGSFVGQMGFAVFWTSSRYDSETIWRRYLYYNLPAIGRFNEYPTHGFSIRCLKDRN